MTFSTYCDQIAAVGTTLKYAYYPTMSSDIAMYNYAFIFEPTSVLVNAVPNSSLITLASVPMTLPTGFTSSADWGKALVQQSP
jgi:hypothetical protein